MTELTVRAVVIGSLLGIVFAASSVYLGLKVGLTVSASIPVAVLSITLFRWLGKAVGARPATILENNIVQTTGSAGESIAAGIAFTLPSLLIMGFDMELVRVLLVGLLGGLIGVLMMIPLRHGLMVKEHGKLAFPEGTACADVLMVGEQGGMNAKTVFIGFGAGFGYMVLNVILGFWKDTASFTVSFWGKLKDATIGFEVSPAMLGVGYIIGPRVAANMLAGGLLAFLVLVPLIHHFGDGLGDALYPSADVLISEMGAGALRNNYILFIGAGAVATGGFIALARAIPTIIRAFRRGMGSIAERRAEAGSPGAILATAGSPGSAILATAGSPGSAILATAGSPGSAILATDGSAVTAATTTPRTERDLSLRVVLGGSLALALAIGVAPVLDVNPVSALLIVLFGFFFVTVSARITGEIGSSSNPISGMTVATLLITCGLFVVIGWTGVEFKAMALTTAALVCVAASNGGTIAQDLKTGHLVGATPRSQQLAILVGVITSAIVIGFVLQLLNESSTTYKAVEIPTFSLAAAKADPKSSPHVKTTDERVVATDGKEYGVVFLHEAVAKAERGKYLIDTEGHLKFFVDPGVCGTYPYHVVNVDKPMSLPVASYAKVEYGTDHLPYRIVDLQAQIPAGTYLVDSEGFVRREAKATEDGTEKLEKVEYQGIRVPIPANVENVSVVDRRSGEALTLRRVTLPEPLPATLPPGRYLATPEGTVVWETKQDVTKFDAPKAQLFRLIIDGTLGGDLPWGLVLAGVFLAIMMELVGVQSLPFAVGLYLPIYTSGGIFVGGVVRWLVDRKRKDSASEAEFSPGMLMASGLIAGGAIAGIFDAVADGAELPLNLGADFLAATEKSGSLGDLGVNLWTMLPFVLLAYFLYRVGKKKEL